MAKTKPEHRALIGLNVVLEDGGEARYEVGDSIDVAHVEQYMVDQGIVEGPDVGPSTLDTPDTAESTAQTDDVDLPDPSIESDTPHHDDQGGAWANDESGAQ